jgi:iron complex transport system ATP-binding protein
MQQHTALRFGFSARDVVAMGRHPHLGRLRGLRPADHAIIDAALAQVDASHLATRSVPSLSGGESARVHLARVLAQATSILMLDEPAAALDVRHQAVLMETLRARAAGGAACLIVVHDLNLAARHADRIALVADGRLRAVGDPWAVMTPARIADAFGHPAEVIAHPACGCPLILPMV